MLSPHSQKCQSDDDWEKRWPREQYPALYMTPAEFKEYIRRREERQRLLDLLAEDITDIALAVFQEASRR